MGRTLSASGAAARLLRASGLAGVLLALGPVPAEPATILCVSQSEACAGSYTSNEVPESNIWKFVLGENDSAPLYTIEIVGTPLSDFTLSIADSVTDQSALDENGSLANFPGATCVPIYDQFSCALFNVYNTDGEVLWANGYLMTITWFANTNPASQPPDDGRNAILRAPDYETFTAALDDPAYDPSPTPTDPAMSGRGDGFSTFGVFRTVPEPFSVALFGVGIGAGLYRRRRALRT
jgi:hypothetical protein